ncbi:MULTISPECIES: xanthine dehydrogenase family protein molybdopterin-binding subunit [Niastella]|uniref:Xanthine dehydrogenase family protein molybdopterin-binding subunit n=1 Tax=Niastella soli TaxID=2821487 RepID=A0ABS3Z433_9BACT|nr:xanthine dehydrogenase family protein molybdopterin-binding subunit [Niastella soli]MBO9204894.1 xanthine dehydrogenase family protein molybdopterin-binding subunit [Niastella soli]
MQQKNSINRRAFLKLSSFTSAALTIGFYFPALAEESTILTAATAEDLGIVLNAFISIDKSGKVNIINHRAEMGQGAFQAVPQMIAEELEVSLDKVSIAFGPGHQTKYGGSQITGGSSTVRGAYKHLLRTGATAREMLVEAAAKKWGVPATECYALDGKVIHRPTNKKLVYGELVEEAAKLTPPKQVALKERKNYTIIGKPLPRQDTPPKVNGKAEFGLDKKLPGMLYAVVERCPYFLGKVKTYNDSVVKTMPGVKHVFKVQMPVFDTLREGIAIVADNTWSAMQARKALQVEWDTTGFEHLDTAALYNRMKEDLRKPGLSQRTGGNFDATYDKAAKKLEAIYETPYEAHACMEPLNCVADVKDDQITVWGPIQGPDWIQRDLAERFKMPMENITVHMTFLGGGFGRKAFTDYTTEAVLISKEIKAPVQVVWTREDDMTQGPFRPGAVYECKAGISDNGRITAFQTKMAAQNMDHQWPHADKSNFNGSTTEGLPEVFINGLDHYSFSDIPTESPIPVMWWRSVYASTNGFAYESFMDELAHAAKLDPLDFHRLQLRDERAEALMQMLEEKTGWRTREKNSGWGMAITECFKSMVGEAVKVSKQPDGKLKIDRIVAVMDCGWYVNPDIIRAQVEGSIVMALGAATTHETHFTDGKAVETNFHQYHMPRIMDVPDIEVYIMENEEKPGGVGEPGLPPFAPALCNAIFDLTGKRIRKLPFNMNEV